MAPLGLNPRSLLFTLYGDYAHPLGQEEVRVGALVELAGQLHEGPDPHLFLPERVGVVAVEREEEGSGVEARGRHVRPTLARW